MSNVPTYQRTAPSHLRVSLFSIFVMVVDTLALRAGVLLWMERGHWWQRALALPCIPLLFGGMIWLFWDANKPSHAPSVVKESCLASFCYVFVAGIWNGSLGLLSLVRRHELPMWLCLAFGVFAACATVLLTQILCRRVRYYWDDLVTVDILANSVRRPPVRP